MEKKRAGLTRFVLKQENVDPHDRIDQPGFDPTF
jgi:hypothetical protein